MQIANNVKIGSFLSFLNRTDGSLKEKIIRSGMWVIVSNIFIQSLAFVRSIILARLLFPEVFGLMGIVSVVVNGFELFTQTGFGTAVIHRQKKVKEATDSAWVLNILRGFVLAALAFVAAPYVARFYNRPLLETIIEIIAFTFIIKGFRNTNIILLQKELDFKRLTSFQIVTSLLKIITVVTLAYVYRNVWALVFGEIAFCVFHSILSHFIIRIRPKLRFNKQLAKELFHYGKFVTGAGIVIFLAGQIDSALIGRVLGMEALGYYVLAYSLADLPAVYISRVISQVMFPAYSKLQNDLPRLRETYLKVLKMIAIISIPAAAGMAILAPEIVGVLYGEKWMPMVPALQVLCIFGAIKSIASTTGPVFNAVGKPKIVFYLVSFKLILIGALIYPLTVNYGIVGTALAVTLPMCLENCFMWIILSQVLSCKFFVILERLFKSLLSSSGMVFLLYAFKMNIETPTHSYYLICSIFLGIVSYLFIMLVLDNGLIKNLKYYVRAN